MKDQPSIGSTAIASIIIFAVAVALRVPSCYESFWVDELHSAWCIWDELSDVAPRADVGHQSPFYFVGLWFWKQIIGGSEVALRLSSVLAVAAACVALTVGIARWNRSLTGGVTAGLILAIESNSIFFGTELRPFAFVIFFASIAAVCCARLAETNSRHDHRGAWIGMIISILLAGLCQPTSLGVLVLLPLALVFIWLVRDRRQLFQITLADGLLIIACAAVGFALWSVTLGESWGQRQLWASFASANSIDQAWRAWDWLSLLILPIIALVGVTIFSRSAPSASTWLFAAIAVVGTLGYWLVAWMEWLPVWHRRYFIAVLPMLAFFPGGTVATIANNVRLSKLAPVIAIGLLMCLGYRQDFHRSLQHYPVALAARGEDWRGAIDWVRDRSESDDRIFLESGLIEMRWWNMTAKLPGWEGLDQSPSFQPIPQQIEFLYYPLRGPYPLARFGLVNYDLDLPQSVLHDNHRQIFLIVRRPVSQIEINPTKWGWVHGNRTPKEIKSFGNVTVIRCPTQKSLPPLVSTPE